MTTVSKSVVQVIARDCGGSPPSKTGSGFVWRDNRTVVTDYHVVLGCSRLAVYVDGAGEIGASVRRILRKADLALLELEDAASVEPLQLASNAPQVNDDLQAIGYYFGVPKIGSVPLRVTLGTTVLQDMLTDQLSQSLSGYMDLQISIIRVSGSLVPGLSGAPVIDHSGAVVGVGSGGLENGTAGIGWAVDAAYVNDLTNAPAEDGQAPAQTTTPLFAYSREGLDPQRVRCGDFAFRRLKVRSLQDLLNTTDDPQGLIKITSNSGLSLDQLKDIKFAVYTETSSGGSVAVPEEATLTEVGDTCVASLDSVFSIRVSAKRADTLFDQNNASQTFENTFDKRGLLWVPNPNYSYVGIMSREDGFIARRKAFDGVYGNFVRGGFFETLMVKHRMLIGVSVAEFDMNTAAIYQCRSTPFGATQPFCAEPLAQWRRWMALLIATHSSTFPRS